MKPRWEPCVIQEGRDVISFLQSHFLDRKRKALLIGGSGFDHRAPLSSKIFSELGLATENLEALFLRENRVIEEPELRKRADENQDLIQKLLPQSRFESLHIFSGGSVYSDSATVIGGREAVAILETAISDTLTDIFIDISSLSLGVYFPLVAYLVQQFDQDPYSSANIHLLVADNPRYDHSIIGIPARAASMIHGFKGLASLDASDGTAMLWIPTLSRGNRETLTKIFRFIQRSDRPMDVCPIVPFPSVDLRLVDKLMEDFQEQLEEWGVDERDLLYAAESDPLDSYRAILKLSASREKLFAPFGGSHVVLSPLGNKMLSVGAMLAAIEMQIPAATVESVGYRHPDESVAAESDYGLKHVWLCGEAYS